MAPASRFLGLFPLIGGIIGQIVVMPQDGVMAFVFITVPGAVAEITNGTGTVFFVKEFFGEVQRFRADIADRAGLNVFVFQQSGVKVTSARAKADASNFNFFHNISSCFQKNDYFTGCALTHSQMCATLSSQIAFPKKSGSRETVG